MTEKNNHDLEEGDVVLGKVSRISGETVFVDIESNGQGTIITSEVAPGRIRNLRDYVVPGKKIACKVLEIENGNIHLSLRRVSAKEKDKVMKANERKESSIKILKSILGDEKGGKVASKIMEEKGNIYEFLQNAREEPKKLKKYIKGDKSKKILEILKKRRTKKVNVKAQFNLSTNQEGGIEKIKEILSPHKENIKYQSAGKYTLSIKAKNYKEANKKRDSILEDIREKAKEEDLDFEIEEK